MGRSKEGEGEERNGMETDDLSFFFAQKVHDVEFCVFFFILYIDCYQWIFLLFE